MANPYEAAARTRKASRIATVLTALGVDADTVEAMDDEGRANAAAVAKVRKPSPEAWDEVVDLVRRHDDAKAYVPADPFACFASAGGR